MHPSHHPSGGPRTAVLLPGSGSDEVFVRAALASPLRAIGLTVLTPTVRPGAEVVDGYLAALDAAALDGPVLVGGISLGAQVAARWAARRTDGAVTGLLLALPAWTGLPGSAPAAVAASVTADAVRRDGLAATIDNTRAQTPGWLGDELARAWARHGAGLADSLDTAAATPGPTATELAGLRVPVAVVGLGDDPVHPLAVARRWAALSPRSALVSSTLSALGRDRATLGRALALAWLRADTVALPVP
ncbi:MAG TPA: alpha/beta hydrolase [Pseudonocardia sp.]|nr:alpha/beta hydrolase [Pseudonocardia sp.]